MGLFDKYKKPVQLPAILTEQEEPVNYNSVLDYLVGLSSRDYDRMLKCAGIYREANVKVAKVLGVKDEPTVALQPPKATEEEQEDAMDAMIRSVNDLETPLIATDEVAPAKPKKAQASEKKVDANS